MKKTYLKLSAFILFSLISISSNSVYAADVNQTDQKSSQSIESSLFIKNFLLKNDINKKIAADSLNFNSCWKSAEFLSANDCLNLLIKSDGDLVVSSIKANPGLMLTIINVDMSSHFFSDTDIALVNDNPLIIYQITSENSSYPILWAVDAVNGTVYSTQDYPGAAIYKVQNNGQIINTYSNKGKCLLWR